ncbi:HutD-family protein [Ensifer sp. Root31]|uniref:HutD/Ves family protein n=1 Tax=Ensifer sp. Root31 TaxID=1736512 RepID=UPI0007098CC6|nr:HutD family protein [Ensifer sp. Root31]KQU91211.1 HutD-family protein [Ensifer sp. Root31]
MKLLPASGHKRMPWKNGGGETIEISVFPEGASLSEFDWRVSMATVASDGPFSAFPGIDRTLSILKGNGMTLLIEGRDPARLTEADAPLAFPADVATSASLINGTIVDLNVMTRRGKLIHRVRRLAIDGEHPLASEATTTMVFCHRGAVELDGNGQTLALSVGDAVILEGPVAATVKAPAPCEVFLIEIDPAPSV